jgi:co-chaperonin GroES (HSP10)
MKLLNRLILVELKEAEGDYSSLIARPESNKGFTCEAKVLERAYNSDTGVWEGDTVLLNLEQETILQNKFTYEGKECLFVRGEDILGVFPHVPAA